MTTDRKLDTDRPIVFFDLETTGVDWRTDRVVQFAAELYLPASGGGVVRGIAIAFLVNPGVPIPPEASAVHKIYDADVARCGTLAAHGEDLCHLFHGAAWAGYNIAAFDVPLLITDCARHGIQLQSPTVIIDVFEIFKKALPRTLDAAVRHYLGDEVADRFKDEAHDAAADVDHTARIFWNQVLRHTEMPASPVDIWNWTRPEGAVDIAGKLYRQGDRLMLNFGKHKGVDVYEAPPDYMRWAMTNVLQPDAKAFINKYVAYRRAKTEMNHD